jgi:beta-glucosidase
MPAELPVYKNASKPHDARVKDLLARMTLEEKIDLLAGENLNTKENRRLGIPKILMTDGPLGPTVRQHSTNYSATINLAASFDLDLMRRVAESIGEETRVMGRNMLLAPMINIIRLPHWGRSFEVFSEDPYLSSRMTVAYVRGVQSKNVIACSKVMAANNQEWNRLSVDARIDERSLREIYLPSLQAAVQEADTWSVMSAYNKVNGDYCAENSYLLTGILKNEWGFKGFVVSDWNGTHSTVKMAKAGLDLEMPVARYYGAALLKAVRNGEVDEATVNDKVKRILGAMFKAGLFDESADQYGGHSNNPLRNRLAREAARKSIVLLKNENNFLPLHKDKVKSIAVIGPNGNVARMAGGGSGNLDGNYAVSPYDGIAAVIGSAHVPFELGIPPKQAALPAIPADFFMLENGEPGIRAEYYNNMDLQGKPVLTRMEKNIEFEWNPGGQADSDRFGSPDPALVPSERWSARWTGLLKSPGEGIYEIGFLANNGVRLYLDEVNILDNWLDALPGQLKSTQFDFKAGRTYTIRVNFYEETGTSHCKLGWAPYLPDSTVISRAVNLAAGADVVVLCLGLNKLLEGEANDRLDLALPAEQVTLLNRIKGVNKNIVVVLNNGTPIVMDEWLDGVPALIEAFYPGQEGGHALADILFGIVNPSGKLPITFPKRWQDSPAFGTYPGIREQAIYKEGIFVGYRHFDKENIEPLFPFGFGLSYTSFELQSLALSRKTITRNDTLQISLTVKNTGMKAGDEIVQLYIQDVKASVEREVKSLKGFQRVSLQAGEERDIVFKINSSDLRFYDVQSKSWVAEPGTFKVLIGNSSRNIKLEGQFDLVQH